MSLPNQYELYDMLVSSLKFPHPVFSFSGAKQN